MKLATVAVTTLLGTFPRLCAVVGTAPHYVDLNATAAWVQSLDNHPTPQAYADVTVPTAMREFIAQDQAGLVLAQKALTRLENEFGPLTEMGQDLPRGLNQARLVYRAGEITLKTPLPDARMLRDFFAFEAHTKTGFAKRGEPIPEPWFKIPVYYKGNPYSVIGHDETVMWPYYSRKLDYELELACIVGKTGRNIPVERAHEHIYGYIIMNDFSARDIQRHEMQCRLGPAKAKDFATAMGPYIVTADEIPDPRNMRMMARINGETWSDGNAGDSHWTFEQMLSHVSMEETLYPGDIFGSGTVGGGCGLELDKWIQPGDVVELEISHLGILRNRVGQPEGEAHPSMPVTGLYSQV